MAEAEWGGKLLQQIINILVEAVVCLAWTRGVLLPPTSALHKTLLSNRRLTVLGQDFYTLNFHLRELARTRRKGALIQCHCSFLTSVFSRCKSVLLDRLWLNTPLLLL